MKLAILGGGVIGVASAYYLTKAGHEVTVVDRQAGPGLETSFANAGEVSPGYASPWAAPDVPIKALKWLAMEHAPLVIKPKLDWRMLCWLAEMLSNCTSRRYAQNKLRMVRLAQYSRAQLSTLRASTGIRYDERMKGTLQLFRSERQLNSIERDLAVLRHHGTAFEVLDRAACISAEPGLAHATSPFAGGLRLPDDETGDCFKFTTHLAAITSDLGATFRFGEAVQQLRLGHRGISAAITNRGVVEADAFVVAMGSHSPALLRPLGIRLPVYPIKGYSLTYEIDDEARAPVSTLLDETYKIAITRLGSRIRVGGMAEVSGFSHALPEKRRKTLEHSIETLFPGSADPKSATFWSGLRPMTPDGTPVIGSTAIPNLFLNTGHGTLGWTMACGSGRILADLVAGAPVEIEADDLGISRYRR